MSGAAPREGAPCRNRSRASAQSRAALCSSSVVAGARRRERAPRCPALVGRRRRSSRRLWPTLAAVRTHGVAWQPSGCPIWEPSGSPTLRPERINTLRPERHPALPPGTDEPSGCHGSLVGGEADPGQRAVTWQPSGCPIQEPSGSPTLRPERINTLRPERHRAPPPRQNEPSSCHGSLVGGEADPGPRALLLKAAAPAVADCLVVCPLDTRG